MEPCLFIVISRYKYGTFTLEYVPSDPVKMSLSGVVHWYFLFDLSGTPVTRFILLVNTIQLILFTYYCTYPLLTPYFENQM